jgi:putative DNA primase/helicase
MSNDVLLPHCEYINCRVPAAPACRSGLSYRDVDCIMNPQTKTSIRPQKTSTLVRAADVVMRPKAWLWPGHLLRGAQELFTGLPGIGKSQAQCDLVARVSRGDTWPDGARAMPPGNVIMITAEDCLDQEVVPRLVAAGAALERVHFMRRIRWENGTERMFLLGEDLDELERNIRKVGDVGLVTIDPITAYMGGIDSYKASDVRGQLAPLQDLAERMNVTFSTITHPPKTRSNRGIDQFIGSQAFIAACRIGHVAIEEVVDGDPTGRILFTNPKNNPHARMPTLAYRVAELVVGQGQTTGEEIVGSHIVWDADPVDTTADQALAAAAGRRGDGGGEGTAKDEAVDFLRRVLADGPVPAKEIQRQAVEACLLGSTSPLGDSKPFRAARQVLGVASSKAGMEDGWVWSLPKAPSDAEDALRIRRPSSGCRAPSPRLTPEQQAAVERAVARAEASHVSGEPSRELPSAQGPVQAGSDDVDE